MKAKIIAKLETSDHDGYCSDAECEYKIETKTYIVDLPEKYNIYTKDKLNFYNKNDEDEFIKLLPVPELNYYESQFCDLSEECSQHNLKRHDYKYTIIDIEILFIL